MSEPPSLPTRYPERPKRDPLQQAVRTIARILTTGAIMYAAVIVLSLPGA